MIRQPCRGARMRCQHIQWHSPCGSSRQSTAMAPGPAEQRLERTDLYCNKLFSGLWLPNHEAFMHELAFSTGLCETGQAMFR